MKDNEILQIINAFQSFPRISYKWSAFLIYWINRADGFIEMMTLEKTPSTTQLLTEKLVQLLETLPNDASDADIVQLISKNFELLFFMAQFNSEFWNSTQESFLDFCHRHHSKLPNQLIIDVPHEKIDRVEEWLYSFIG